MVWMCGARYAGCALEAYVRAGFQGRENSSFHARCSQGYVCRHAHVQERGPRRGKLGCVCWASPSWLAARAGVAGARLLQAMCLAVAAWGRGRNGGRARARVRCESRGSGRPEAFAQGSHATLRVA